METTVCKGFQPTAEELRQLARHWVRVRLHSELDHFEFALYSCDDFREIRVSSNRLREIAAVLGEDAVQQAVDEVQQEYARRMGPEQWHAFRRGTREEYDRASLEICTRREELWKRRDNREAAEGAWTYLVQNPSRVHIDHDGYLWSLAPSYDGPEAEQALLLRRWVTSPRGDRVCAGDYELARPAGWYPPYGLRGS
jgi:hypothetical protein